MRKSSKHHRSAMGVIDLASFEVLSDHGETIEDDVVVDESSDESTETMPPLPPASWFKDTRISRCAAMRVAGSFETWQWERLLSLIVGIGGTSSLTFCSMRALDPTTESSAKVASQ